MRKLKKLPEPGILLKNKAEWTRKYKEAVEEDRKGTSYWNNSAIREVLCKETSDRCAYCDAHILQVAQSHIEHYRPRKNYPELVVDWDNLTIACPRCNSRKLDKFSEDVPFINPFLDDPDEHFIFFGDLLFARDSLRGKFTNQILRLNDEAVVSARARRLSDVGRMVELWQSEEGILKDGILEQIQLDLKTGEYYAFVRSLLMRLGVPIPITSDEISV